jgi:hypothetical protein
MLSDFVCFLFFDVRFESADLVFRIIIIIQKNKMLSFQSSYILFC